MQPKRIQNREVFRLDKLSAEVASRNNSEGDDEILSQHEKDLFDNLAKFHTISTIDDERSDKRHGESQLDGFSYFETDPRDFHDIMLDWQIHVGIGDPKTFLEHIGLSQEADIVEGYEAILHKVAAPSKRLAVYLTNLIPEAVASKNFFYNSSALARRLCEREVDISLERIKETPEQDLEKKRKKRRGGSYLDGPFPISDLSKEDTTASHFYLSMITRLKEIVEEKGEKFDEAKIIKNIAKAVGVDPWVIQGFIPPPSHIPAENLAADVAHLLYSEHHAFSEFYETSLQFFEGLKSVGITAGLEHGISRDIGEVLFLLRDNAGLSAYRLSGMASKAKKRGAVHANELRAIEKGKIVTSYEPIIYSICSSLGIDEKLSRKVARTVWQKHDEKWNEKLAEASTPNEEFMALRETNHLSKHEVATVLLELKEIELSRSLHKATKLISDYESGCEIDGEFLAPLQQSLQEAISRKNSSLYNPVEYQDVSGMIKKRRQKIHLSQEALAYRIVDLCREKTFWQHAQSVQALLAAMETGRHPTQDLEKLSILAEALEYDEAGTKEFIEACTSRSKAYWESELKDARKIGEIVKARRNVAYLGQTLVQVVDQNWNDEAKRLWDSQSSFISSFVRLEQLSLVPTLDRLRFVCKIIGQEPEYIENLAQKGKEKHESYWLEKFHESESFGSAIFALRKLRRIKLREVSEAVALSTSSHGTRQMVDNWERDASKPTWQNYKGLCQFLSPTEDQKKRLDELWSNKRGVKEPKPTNQNEESFNKTQARVSEKYGNELAARLDSYLTKETLLRPRQREVLTDIIRHLDNGNAAGHIKRPTGTGKTITFSSEIVAFNTPVGARHPAWDMPSMIIVPRLLLADQTAKEVSEKLKIPMDKIGVYHSGIGDGDKAKALKKPILLTTYGSARSLLIKKQIKPDSYPVVILDEVHMAKGEQTIPIVKKLLGNSLVHGYTATDAFLIRGHYRNISHYLFDDNDAIHRTTFREAVIYGEVAPVKNIIFETNVDPNITRSDNNDYTRQELRKVVDYEGRDEAAIDAFAKFVDPDTSQSLRNMQSAWYCNGIKHAKKVAETLNIAFGSDYAVAVSGKTPIKELQKILKRQKAGEIRAIVNADLLIQGWDSPSTQVCVMLRPSKSPTIIEQTGGRIARIDENNPFKIGYVLNFIDDRMPDSLTFAQVVDGVNVVPSSYYDNIRTNAPRKEGGNFERKVLFIEKVKMKAHYTMREIVSFLQKRKDQEELEKLEPKTEVWLSKEEYDRYLGINSLDAKFIELWAKIFETGEVDGNKIKSGYKQSATRQPFCVHIDEANLILEKLGRKIIKVDGLKTSEWLSSSELATTLRTSSSDEKYKLLWEEVKASKRIGEKDIKCGYRKSGKNKPFCIHESEVAVFKDRLGLDVDQKTSEWKAKTEFKILVGVGRSDEDFLKLWDEVETTGKINDVQVKSGYRATGTIRPFCIHESEVSLFKKLLGYEQKTAEWLTVTEFARAINIRTTNAHFLLIVKEVQESGKIDGKEVNNSYKVSGTISRFCIHESEKDFIKQKIAERAQAETGKPWIARTRKTVKSSDLSRHNNSDDDNSSQLISCADLWNEIRKNSQEIPFAALQKTYLQLASAMPDDAECGRAYSVRNDALMRDVQLKYDIHPISSEECLYASKRDVLEIISSPEQTSAVTEKIDRTEAVASSSKKPDTPNLHGTLPTFILSAAQLTEIGRGGRYDDRLAKVLYIEDKAPLFKNGFGVVVAIMGCGDSEKLCARVNEIIARRIKSDEYDSSFKLFNKEIADRWKRTGAIYSEERRYLPIICEALEIPSDSEDYNIFLNLAAEDNTLSGRTKKIRSKYINQHTVDGGFKEPNKGYFADYLYLMMKSADIQPSELAEEIGLKVDEIEACMQGAGLILGVHLQRLAKLFNLDKEATYARAVFELIKSDQRRLNGGDTKPDSQKAASHKPDRISSIHPSAFEQRADIAIG